MGHYQGALFDVRAAASRSDFSSGCLRRGQIVRHASASAHGKRVDGKAPPLTLGLTHFPTPCVHGKAGHMFGL